MLISKNQPLNHIHIEHQRYHDQKVLIADWKVKEMNKVTFNSNSRKDMEYYISGEKIKACPKKNLVSKNGRPYSVYEVPLSDLEILEYREDIRETAFSLFED